MTDDPHAAIRTPDQRLRVFVSSTLAELADERAAVAKAISAVGLTPVLFELGARPHPPQELYRAYLAQSDIFVGLYWERYGWVGPGMDISGLEDEFRLSGSIPRLLYVKDPAPEREPRLTAMIEELQTEGTDAYRPFRTPRELGRLVRDDLALLLSERFAAGGAAPAGSVGAAASEHRTRLSLPAPSTSLVGRDDDIAAVTTLLVDPAVRLVTLTGPGGVGKTRLAVAVAGRLEARDRWTATFVPLASVTDPAAVLPRVAAAVGASIEGARTALDVLAEHFAGAPALVVLDNLEQVTGAAPVLDELLACAPDLTVLATSRTVLRLRAERDYPVSTLAVPAATDGPILDQLASSAAVALFVDRAQAVRYDFALTADNAAAVVEICRRLDGLPLAIELAAARTRLLDPAALLARLATSLDALGTGPVDLPERQRTLRATVEWSIGLLGEDEQELLARLSVFVDGWTLDAAVDVAGLGEDRTLDLLDALAGQSLVQIEATAAGPRFRMLTSVRDIAAERLAAGGHLDAVRQRHAACFRALVDGAEWPAERQAAWAARLRADEENLRAAIRWFFEHDVTPLPHLFHMLWLFWQVSDRMPEGRAWTDELQRRSDELDDQARFELLLTSSLTAVEVGDDGGALAMTAEIEQLAPGITDPYLQRVGSLALSWTLPIRDDFDGALAAATDALTGFRAGDEPFLAFAMLTVGILDLAMGRQDEARSCLTEVAELGRWSDNRWLEAAAGAQLAAIAIADGDLVEARHLVAAAVAFDDDAQMSTLTITFALIATARLLVAEGDERSAAVALGAVHALRERSGLQAWPTTRRGEADVAALVARALGAEAYADAFAEGMTRSRSDALHLVRASATATNEREGHR
ncbi:DUF4062 domain-containing protein [Aquihabitans sp. McL0605]|uniref:DUF4062 domain-containing protein n=1 Tax=Aquihabitans sp. McL0605 TaxID=3415671 RepID=UPI003CEAAD61